MLQTTTIRIKVINKGKRFLTRSENPLLNEILGQPALINLKKVDKVLRIVEKEQSSLLNQTKT